MPAFEKLCMKTDTQGWHSSTAPPVQVAVAATDVAGASERGRRATTRHDATTRDMPCMPSCVVGTLKESMSRSSKQACIEPSTLWLLELSSSCPICRQRCVTKSSPFLSYLLYISVAGEAHAFFLADFQALLTGKPNGAAGLATTALRTALSSTQDRRRGPNSRSIAPAGFRTEPRVMCRYLLEARGSAYGELKT